MSSEMFLYGSGIGLLINIKFFGHSGSGISLVAHSEGIFLILMS